MDHKDEEFLGVDVGSARVGIARGSDSARLAEPLVTVPAATALDELKKLADVNKAAGIVVGLPRSLDGRETAQTGSVREWAAAAKKAIGLPFYWQDEALTSAKAEDLVRKDGPGSDAAAAAIILQDFLDTPEAERVRC